MKKKNYRLKTTEAIALFIRKAHPHLKKKFRAALKIILEDPEIGKSLKEDLEGLYSYRVGKFRIIYRVSSREFLIELFAIGPRSSIYEETFRLIKKNKH